jgi:hypothetical protein
MIAPQALVLHTPSTTILGEHGFPKNIVFAAGMVTLQFNALLQRTRAAGLQGRAGRRP